MTHARQAHSHEQVRLHDDQTLQLQSLDELKSFYACTMVLTPTILVDQLHQQCDRVAHATFEARPRLLLHSILAQRVDEVCHRLAHQVYHLVVQRHALQPSTLLAEKEQTRQPIATSLEGVWGV